MGRIGQIYKRLGKVGKDCKELEMVGHGWGGLGR